MQAEHFLVCAVACSGFLGRKLGQEDPRTGSQETQEPGLTGSLHQWRSGGRRPQNPTPQDARIDPAAGDLEALLSFP